MAAPMPMTAATGQGRAGSTNGSSGSGCSRLSTPAHHHFPFPHYVPASLLMLLIRLFCNYNIFVFLLHTLIGTYLQVTHHRYRYRYGYTHSLKIATCPSYPYPWHGYRFSWVQVQVFFLVLKLGRLRNSIAILTC